MSDNKALPQGNVLWIPAGISVGLLLLTHVFQIGSQKALFFVNRCTLGWDSRYAYDAALRMSQGTSPYVHEEYCWPTFFPWVLWKSGLMAIGCPTLARSMIWLTLGCILCACYLAGRLFSDANERLARDAAPILLIVFSSFPVYFLLDRGNLDGLTMAFTWSALWLAFRRRSNGLQALAGGALLAVAFAIKIYPIVLLVPLLIFRRFRMILGFLAATAAIVAVDPAGWRALVTEALPVRFSGQQWTGIYLLIENTSLEAFFLIVAQLVQEAGGHLPSLAAAWSARAVAALALGAAVVSAWLLRRERDGRIQLAWTYSFIPLVFASLRFAGAYSMVHVIPLAFSARFLMGRFRVRQGARIALGLVLVGIGLGQVQAVALAKIFSSWTRQIGNVPRHDFGDLYNVLSASCSVGLFLVVLATVIFQALAVGPVIKAWVGQWTGHAPRARRQAPLSKEG